MDKNKNISWKSVDRRLRGRFLASLWWLLIPVAFGILIYLDVDAIRNSDDAGGALAFALLIGIDLTIAAGLAGRALERWIRWDQFRRAVSARDLEAIKFELRAVMYEYRQEQLGHPHLS